MWRIISAITMAAALTALVSTGSEGAGEYGESVDSAAGVPLKDLRSDLPENRDKAVTFSGIIGTTCRSAAYSFQARRWLTRALDAEVPDDLLTEAQAMRVASQVMQEDRLACFDLEGTQAAIRKAMAA